MGAHAHRPKPAAGRAHQALPRSAANSRPCLCLARILGLAAALRQWPWQQEAAARGGRSHSKARRQMLLTRARTVIMSRCRASWCSGW